MFLAFIPFCEEQRWLQKLQVGGKDHRIRRSYRHLYPRARAQYWQTILAINRGRFQCLWSWDRRHRPGGSWDHQGRRRRRACGAQGHDNEHLPMTSGRTSNRKASLNDPSHISDISLFLWKTTAAEHPWSQVKIAGVDLRRYNQWHESRNVLAVPSCSLQGFYVSSGIGCQSHRMMPS